MDFFRRFQKPILIATSAVVIASFVFYGVISVVQPSSSSESVKEKTVAFKTPKGRKVYDTDVAMFEKILNVAMLSRQSPLLDEEKTFVKRWFEDRIATDMLKVFSKDFIPHVKEKLEALKNDHGYIHPKAPYISQYRTLCDLSEEFKDLYQKLKSAEEVTAEIVENFLDFFMVGSEFSSDLIRTLLIYQQKQLSQNQHDPSLPFRNFAHFGWKKSSDWLGGEGVTLLARCFEVLYDLSLPLKYKPTLAEVQKKFFQKDMNTPEEMLAAEKGFLEALNKEGIPEGEFWAFWQKWFVVENWMNIISHEIIFDPTLLNRTYEEYLTDVDADVFELPQELNFRDVFQMLEFQVYLDTIAITNPGLSKEKLACLELPGDFLKPEELKKRVPELVQFSTPITMQRIARQDIDAQISLKTLWSWQESDAGWKILLQQFPYLKEKATSTIGSRLDIIKSLPTDLKKNVDDFSLELTSAEFLAKNPKDDATGVKEILQRDSAGNCYLKKNKIDVAQLKTFLEKGQVGSDIIISSKPYFYRFKITGPQTLTILSFADASRRGITKTMLDQKLEKTYQTLVKAANPIVLTESDKAKPMQDCRLQVAEMAFEHLFKALKMEAKSYPSSLDDSALFAVRFCPYFETIIHDLNCPDCTSRKVKLTAEIEDINDLAEQWYLIKKHQKIPLLEIKNHENLPQNYNIVEWKDRLILLKVNGKEENQTRKESKTLELKKTLEHTYLREKIQEKIIEAKESGKWNV